MNKNALIKTIIASLRGEREVFVQAATASRKEATDEQSKAENKYDTRGLEASYLARGQSRQVAEIESSIAAFETLVPRAFTKDEPVSLGALVELEYNKERLLCFVGPRSGGTEVMHDDREVMVITPQSPLGEQIQNRKQGDRFQITLAGARHPCRVLTVE
jgi:transcription elongation GreA/GreB family factor